MSRTFVKRLLCLSIFGSALALGSVGQAKTAELPDDIIARVGDQPITFSEINTMLNSSAVVGVSIPAVGTPERDRVRITLLDKVVSANLIYLDALAKGVDQEPEYRRDIQRFTDSILADLYLRRMLEGEAAVSAEEIQAFFDANAKPGTELTDDARVQIEAVLRKEKLDERRSDLRDALRDGVEVVIHERELSPAGDEERSDATPVAEIDGQVIPWGDVKTRLIAAGKGAVQRDPLAMEPEARRRALQSEIDLRLAARKARGQGLEEDPVYRARVQEYTKTRLINLHRARLAEGFDPSDEELARYYETNRSAIMVPAARKVQEVVLETREAADAVKAELESGDLTMWEAARDYSIAPGAERDLGEIGWVKEGRALPQLNDVIFALGPDEIGGPVQSPAGWHLYRVMDVRDARYDDLSDPRTRQQVRRRYIHDRLDAYVVGLRKDNFPVEVYQENLVRLAQQEADMVEELTRKGAEPGSVTQKRIEELQRIYNRSATGGQ
jgi:hypothetical protein